MRSRLLFALLIVSVALVACRQQEPAGEDAQVTVEMAIEEANPGVGETAVLITITDADGNPVNDALVTVRGDMDHAGMQPVIPDAVATVTDGVYRIPFEFTMGGDWIIEANILLSNGVTVSETLNVSGVASDMDDDDMNMDMETETPAEATESSE